MMKKLQDYLLIVVFIMTAILAAVAGLKVYSGYMKNRAEEEARLKQHQEEILARNAEAQNRVQEMQVEIVEMQDDVEALQAFIDETVNAANEVQSRKAAGGVSENGDTLPSDGSMQQADSVFGDGGQDGYDSISENASSDQPDFLSEDDVSGQPGAVSGNDGSGFDGSVSENGESDFDGSVSENDGTFDGSISGNGWWSVSGNTVSGNGDTTVSGNDDFGFLMGSVSQNDADVNYYDSDMASDSIFDEWRPIYEQSDMTLEERKELRTSYQETLEVNQADREWIAENQYDFSQMKIACLGDSITKAANLEGEENYEQYAYPARLQELLGAQEVYNLGIGGSSIGRYWADAFVDRYTEIPADSDIIIVMGGTNDGFCVSDEEFGNLDERAYHTFCGDLNELMSGLRENYPDAQIFFATPLPNVLQDYLMSERDYLLPQKDFVEVIQVLADEYDFELIDLYNSNVLDSHDANIITEYMPDGVHGNPAGYQILAERFAGELVRYYNEDSSESAEGNGAVDGTSAENDGMGEGVNAGSAVGGNTGTNATVGVGGNAGANTGVITVVGGNAGIGGNSGTDTGDETDAEDGGTDGGTDTGNGMESTGDSAESGNGEVGSEDGIEGGEGTGMGDPSDETNTGNDMENAGSGVENGTSDEVNGTNAGKAGSDTGTGEKTDANKSRGWVYQ